MGIEEGENVDDAAIDELFGNESADDVETEESEASEEVESQETEEESSEEPESESETTEDSQSETEELKTVPIAALLDERRKREAAQKKADELAAKLPQEDSEAPDMYDDPEGYKAYVRQQVENDLYAERVDRSRSEMLEKHDDYEDKENTFLFLASKDKTLVDEMNKHPEPARYAYEKAVEFENSKMSSLEERIRAKIMAELGQTTESKSEPSEAEKRKKSALNTPSLTKATATDSNTQPIEKDEDLDGMFADQAY